MKKPSNLEFAYINHIPGHSFDDSIIGLLHKNLRIRTTIDDEEKTISYYTRKIVYDYINSFLR